MTVVDVVEDRMLNDYLAQFSSLGSDEKLGLLWMLYQRMDPTVLKTAATALFSQRVQEVVVQIQQLNRDDQIEALRDIVAGASTRISHAYGVLNINMKLAFWYRLTQAMAKGQITHPQMGSQGAPTGEQLIDDLNHMGFNQQIFCLRQMISEVGNPVSTLS